MGIYLPNIEMPRKGQMLVTFPDGTSYVCFNGMRERLAQTTAIPVPESHGDLVERNIILHKMRLRKWMVGRDSDPVNIVEDAPTVIPAEEE